MSTRRAVIGVAIIGLSTSVLAGPTVTAQASTGASGNPTVPFAPGVIAKSTNYAGYGFKGKSVTKAAATFTVPSITCSSAERGVAAGVFLIGSAPVFTSALAEAACSGGTAEYGAAIYVNDTLITSLIVSPNDEIAVTVKESATSSKVTLDDITSGTTQSSGGSGGIATKWFIADDSLVSGSVELGVPTFTSNAFTSASVDETALGSFTPRTEYERVKGSTVQLVPTSITGGQSFNVLFKHN